MIATSSRAQQYSTRPKSAGSDALHHVRILFWPHPSLGALPKGSFLIVLIACAAIFFGCDARSALDKRLSGQWRRGSVEFVFQSGTISTRQTGYVYATYEVLDEQTIRFRRDNRDSPIDLVVKVSFPEPNRMLWQRRRGEEFIDWWNFERVPVAR